MNGKSPIRRGLGRGLDALLGADREAPPEEARDVAPVGRAQLALPVANIRPGRLQPRRRFDAEEVEALAKSIREKGVLQPILVRPIAGESGMYELVAGERRWRAAQQAQLHEIPALVRELTDRDTLEVALVENLQRQDLTAIEEARGYQRMIDDFRRTQEDVAEVVGKSRPHVANTLRLLTLPLPVQEMLEDGIDVCNQRNVTQSFPRQILFDFVKFAQVETELGDDEAGTNSDLELELVQLHHLIGFARFVRIYHGTREEIKGRGPSLSLANIVCNTLAEGLDEPDHQNRIEIEHRLCPALVGGLLSISRQSKNIFNAQSRERM
ncbi:MAG TPA: ParB/RepB/Spo0J family partition protein [Sphingomicrobium sp.]|nr:ParB/RepB/Spo0J family partition protein [Sphingomicrobium sp.]